MRFLKSFFKKTYKTTRQLVHLFHAEFHFSKIKESEPTTITIAIKPDCYMDIVIVKRTYVMERKKGLFFRRKKKFFIYQVTGIVPECFPAKMKNVMNSTLQIPSLLPRVYPEEYRISATVSAFLDIKMSNILRNEKK